MDKPLLAHLVVNLIVNLIANLIMNPIVNLIASLIVDLVMNIVVNSLSSKDLMPRDIMSSEPRRWIVLGQLVVAVQCCAEASQRLNMSSAKIPSSALTQMT